MVEPESLDHPFADEMDRAVAQMVLDGETNRAIARRVDLPEGTVKWRLHRMYERLGVGSRVQFAIRVRDLLASD